MRYSPELKEAILRRILPPNNEPITKVAREERLPGQTIHTWRDKARSESIPAPAKDNSEEWSTQCTGKSIETLLFQAFQSFLLD